MQLHKLTIHNFRGINHTEIYLKEHTVLLGANNVGKSTIIDATGLLLGKEKLVRNLNDYDFYKGSPKAADRILVQGLIGGFSTNDPTKNPLWFNDNNGGTIVWFNPKTKACKYGDFEEGYILCAEIAFCARFDEEELEFKTLRYFVDGESDPFEDENNLRRLSSVHVKE